MQPRRMGRDLDYLFGGRSIKRSNIPNNIAETYSNKSMIKTALGLAAAYGGGQIRRPLPQQNIPSGYEPIPINEVQADIQDYINSARETALNNGGNRNTQYQESKPNQIDWISKHGKFKNRQQYDAFMKGTIKS